MGSAERTPRLALAGLACGLLVLGACDSPPAGERSGNLQISGPIGTEYSIHPRAPTEGRMTIAGCCSVAVADSSVTRLEGDVDGRELQGPGYRAILSFGNGLARAETLGPPTSATPVDGVTLEKRVAAPGPADRPRLRYRAVVPLDARAKARNVREPGLEIEGWCDGPSGCAKLEEMLDGIRF